MAEGRFLSRNIAFSEQLGQVSMEADYLFMRMLPHLDVDGRLAGSPKSVKARVCPLRADMTDAVVANAIAELDQAELLKWYEVDGMPCIEYPNFSKYQTGLRRNREADSKLPSSSHPNAIKCRRTPGVIPEDSGRDAGGLRQGGGTTPASPPEDSGHSKLRKEKLRKGKERKVTSFGSVAGAPPLDPESVQPPPDQPAVPDQQQVADELPATTTVWVALLGDDWKEITGGLPNYPKLGRHLKPAVDTYGLDRVREAWKRFCASPEHKYGPANFVEHFGDFEPKLIGINGEYTPEQLRDIGVIQ